ncbi:MAG: OadG family protein [Lachnospiraceae bacterium]|nr:OadG family protein [Lachnospiraceae bacterium]
MVQQALLNVLMGMGSVFAVLIIICLIIYAFNIFPYLEEKKKASQSKPQESATAPTPTVSATESTDDAALVAAITAAISAYTGMSDDGFIVRSIVRR